MNLRTLFPILFVLMSLAACSNNENPAETAVPDTTAIEVAPDATTDEAAVDETADTATVESVDETEGLAEADDADTSEIVFDEPEAAPTELAPITYQFKEGSHFRRMTSSQGTSSAPDKIEVAEVFWYGCSHCYNFDPVISKWEENKAADVSFVRIPVVWNPTNEIHARAMYTADALGILDEAHEAIFKAIHTQNNQLSSRAGLATFFARLGIENDAFVEAYESFGVETAAKRAATLTGRYGVRSVPILIVNGKYAVDGPEVKTFGDMLNVADELVERERRGD
jgi:thiol:disulfide interchange protein DsbA